jgi:hypothetical protein
MERVWAIVLLRVVRYIVNRVLPVSDTIDITSRNGIVYRMTRVNGCVASDRVQSACWLDAHDRTTYCRSLRRCRAVCRSCLQHISKRADGVRISPLTFDPHVGERCAIRNELGFDALSFERVPTLCIWMRRAWVRNCTTDHRGHKSSWDEPHCEKNAHFLRGDD